MKYVVHKFLSPLNNNFYFSIKASNGQIVAQSEGYTTKAKRDQTADRLVAALSNGCEVKVKEQTAKEYEKACVAKAK